MNKINFVKELEKRGIDCNESQLNLLWNFMHHVLDTNEKFNLTAITNLEDVYLKHFYDCSTICKIIDLNKEYENMKSLDNNTSGVICLNNALPDCSPKGTCILEFTSLYFNDCFDKEVTIENYYNLKEELALKFIDKFERSTGILIKDYIEEIEIATPCTFARYTNSPQGSIYGYAASCGDNLLSRMMGMFNENYINGLRFCGGSSFRLSGYSSSYLSGETAAGKYPVEKDGVK